MVTMPTRPTMRPHEMFAFSTYFYKNIDYPFFHKSVTHRLTDESKEKPMDGGDWPENP